MEYLIIGMVVTIVLGIVVAGVVIYLVYKKLTNKF